MLITDLKKLIPDKTRVSCSDVKAAYRQPFQIWYRSANFLKFYFILPL